MHNDSRAGVARLLLLLAALCVAVVAAVITTGAAKAQMIQLTCGPSQVKLEENGSEVCRPIDYPALKALYLATDGDNWTNNDNWLSTQPLSAWHGIEVLDTNAGRVATLELTNNGLSGAIPPEIGDLTELRLLELSNNTLTGPIPPEIGNLVELTTLLNLSDNQLTGGIPAQISLLVKLDWLQLNNNQLTGNIPAAFGSLSMIHYMYLQDNRLSGALPLELANIPPESHLHLDLRGNAGLCAPKVPSFVAWTEAIAEFHGEYCAPPAADAAGELIYRSQRTDIVEGGSTTFWFPVRGGECNPPDPVRCGWLNTPADLRDNFNDRWQPVSKLATDVYTALHPSPDSAPAGGPHGAIKVELWAVFPHPERGMNSVSRVAGTYRTAFTICMPSPSADRVIQVYDRQSRQWTTLESVEPVHSNHVCGLTYDLGYIGLADSSQAAEE